MLNPVISYAEGPGPSVPNVCLCFCPKLNEGADGLVEITTFLCPTNEIHLFLKTFGWKNNELNG